MLAEFMEDQKSKKTTQLSKYDWMIYARSYLKMAQIGIEELKNQKYINPGLDRTVFYEEKWILIPIIWNLKHAMELAVKTLGISIDKQYLVSHNLGELTQDIQKSIKDLGMEEDLKIETIESFTKIINKYYRCEFWDKKFLKIRPVLDVKNDIFRYPDKAFFCTDILQILKDIPFNDEMKYAREIEELSDDVRELKILFGALMNRITQSKYKDKK